MGSPSWDAKREIPGMWPRWRQVPREGTIVHILAMGHLSDAAGDEFSMLPGGFFAEIADDTCSLSEGVLMVLTIPQSVTQHPRFNTWNWPGPFPFHLRDGPGSNGMRLEVVPDDVVDAVRAFVALSTGDEHQPIVVEDGWLC
jgi:hypothetical protein